MATAVQAATISTDENYGYSLPGYPSLFPAGITMVAAFNKNLMYFRGKSLGVEFKGKEISHLYMYAGDTDAAVAGQLLKVVYNLFVPFGLLENSVIVMSFLYVPSLSIRPAMTARRVPSSAAIYDDGISPVLLFNKRSFRRSSRTGLHLAVYLQSTRILYVKQSWLLT
ncbi:hypothetical protein V1517DRAFT_338736 [Lipomyces orientalis]|uniref:Uncharacterized protein n=1 Tax=Lipomyces orientalis TaxID=1233043 RepID=A0ACC3TNK4_9ASCO